MSANDNVAFFRTPDGGFVQNSEGHFLMINNETNTYFYAEAESDEEIMKENSETMEQENPQCPSPPTPTTSCGSFNQNRWARSSILALIEIYKVKQGDFKNTTVRKDMVWKSIATIMCEKGHVYTKAQVENKFKYLKARYIRKKDNQGARGSGESPLHFEFFEEFDAIFGEKPNITPIAIASSIVDASVPVNPAITDEPKAKRSKLEKEVISWKRDAELRRERAEEAKERRHAEKQELARNAMTSFKDLMNRLIDKL